jgi:hypothetical protein
MKQSRGIKISIVLAVSLIMLVSCTQGGTINPDEKVNVRAAMKEFVDAKLEKDKNVYKIEQLKGEFDYLHEGVEKKGDLYVSCADVKVGADVYDIDYYVKDQSGKYIVIKEVLHKINKEKVNRTLWQKE